MNENIEKIGKSREIKNEITSGKSKKNKEQKIRIDEPLDKDFEVMHIKQVGLTAPLGLQGAVILESDDGKEFPISAFSGEVAGHISNFIDEKHVEIPSVYKMVEQICEELEIFLVKIKIYDNGASLRANLYFTGKKDLVLRNYRASDAIALAAYYKVPILLRKSLLENH